MGSIETPLRGEGWLESGCGGWDDGGTFDSHCSSSSTMARSSTADMDRFVASPMGVRLHWENSRPKHVLGIDVITKVAHRACSSLTFLKERDT